MTNFFSALILTCAVLAGSDVTAAWARGTSPTFSSLFGDWRLVKVVGFGDPSGSEKDAKAGVGTIVTISAVKISDTHEPSAACAPRHPVVKYVVAEPVLEKDFGTTLKDLKLPKGLMKRKMLYLDAGCASAFVLNEKNLLWPLGNGFYYLARRQPLVGS